MIGIIAGAGVLWLMLFAIVAAHFKQTEGVLTDGELKILMGMAMGAFVIVVLIGGLWAIFG